MDLIVSHIVVALVAFVVGLTVAKRGRDVSQHPSDTRTQIAVPPSSFVQDHPADPSTEEPALSAGNRIFQIVFLSGWLIAWTAGIVAAFGAFAQESGGPKLFLGGWLIAACAGWVMAVAALRDLIQGRTPKGFSNFRR